MLYDVADSVTTEFHDIRDFQGFNLELIRALSIETPVSEADFQSMKSDEITLHVFEAATKHYREKNQRISTQVLPVIKQVYENPGNTFENIVIPITDGIHNFQVMANLKRSFETQGREVVLEFEKQITLGMIDDAWKEHLREMDDLKQAVQNAALEQKDPLLIYKLESFNLFKDMVTKTSKQTISFLVKGNLPSQDPQQNMQQARFSQHTQAPKQQEKLVESRSETGSGETEKVKPKQQPIIAEQKVGRNDPCPCGSGKKFKACHGK
jgi:preprotein translocase subunit SecA